MTSWPNVSIGRWLVRIWRRVWSGLRYYLSGLYIRFDEHHVFLMSGGLAFSLFVCAVPLILVLFAGIGYILDEPKVLVEINAFIDQLIPYPEYAESIKTFIGERVQRTANLTQVAGLIGVVGLLFASTGLFSSLRTILNTAFQSKNTESVLLGKLWDFAMVFLILIIFLILILLLPLLEAIMELAGSVGFLSGIALNLAQKVMVNLASLVLLVGAFFLIYWLVPWTKPDRRTIMVSSISAAVLWLAAKELFGVYVSRMVTLKHIYGVYAFLVVAAFWIYYSAMVMIVAAEIGQLSCERRAKSKEECR